MPTNKVSREEYDALAKKVKKLESQVRGDKPKVKRKPSEFNKFVAKKIAEIKKANPDQDHKVNFSQAIKAWNDQKKESKASLKQSK